MARIGVEWHQEMARAEQTTARGLDFIACSMTIPLKKPETLAEIIDRMDWLREELLTIQRTLEKIAEEPSVAPRDSRDGDSAP